MGARRLALLAGVVSSCVFALGLVFGGVVALAAAPETPVTSSPATSITTTSAVLDGVLNPGALVPVEPGSYEFVYRQSASECRGEGEQATGAVESLGLPAEAVSKSVGGLLANATYTFCLLARNAEGEALGLPVSFTTSLEKPSIGATATTNITASSAGLTARIDPHGADTTYRFEYGTSTSYGTNVPVPDGDAGAGHGEVAVSAPLSGLSANVTYHWRVVASSAGGTSVSEDQTFVDDTSGGGLPDGRQYELVTPVQKNGALVRIDFSAYSDISENGSRVIVRTLQCFADSVSCHAVVGSRVGGVFAFSRSDGVWTPSALAPSAATSGSSTNWLVSADTDTALSYAPAAAGEEEWVARQPDGSFLGVGPMTPPSAGSNPYPAYFGLEATADLTHVVYGLEQHEGYWPFDETGGGLATVSVGPSLYEYVGVGDSQPVLVGVTGPEGSTKLVSECGTELGGEGYRRVHGALSADGEVVFFTALGQDSGGCYGGRGITEPEVDEVYARVDGSQTVPISRRSPLECTGASGCLGSPPSDALFEGASEDGSKVFFTSTQQLTDSASEDSSESAHRTECHTTTGVNGCNLYEYDFDNPAGRNLMDVSAGDTSGGGPRVQGVVAISPDGSHVYFVAEGVLSGVANSQGQVAQDGAENLYVFERDAEHPGGHTAFVATLSGADSLQWVAGVGVANVTPGGRFLVFTSDADLTRDDTSTTGAGQVFRYDAQTEELTRISIGEEGFDDNGNAGSVEGASIVSPASYLWQFSAGPGRTDPTMSNDGSFVFFESPVALTPGALDDGAENVYEWHEGHVYLISSDRDDTGDVSLLGTDASGANVFFTTPESLVAQDTDTQVDVYDARVCTASEPCVSSSPPVACQGEACHGTPGGAPVLPVGATVAFDGPGNLAPAPIVAVVKPKAKHKTKKPRKRKPGRSGRSKARGHAKRRGK